MSSATRKGTSLTDLGASGTVNQAVVPPCSLRSMPATPPRKATLVATEETEGGESGGDKHVGMREGSVWAREGPGTAT